jgi:5-methylcytosine-specific restriction endonuclease McrA
MPINYSDYPPNWKEIRERILKRANHCCEHCGANNRFIRKRDRIEPGPQEMDMYFSLARHGYSKAQAMARMGFTEVVLTIAHLDHDKENWDVTDDRLAALCQRCHLKYDMPRHIENRKYGRHFRKQQINLF